MKKLLIALLCISFSSSINAQTIGNLLKNKIKDKIEKKEDVKEEEEESQYRADPPAENPQSEEEAMEQYLQMMGGGAIDIDQMPNQPGVVPSDFVGSFEMDLSTISENGKEKHESTIKYYVTDYQFVMVPEIEVEGQDVDSRILIDRQKGVTIILTETQGMKTGMVLNVDDDLLDLSSTEFEEELAEIDVKVYKNETKMIEGYKCYKVVTTTEDFESVSWVTEDVRLNMEKMMSFMNVSRKDDGNVYQEKFGAIDGWPVKTTSTDKTNGDVMTMTMKNITKGNVPASITSTEGFNLMQMPNFGGME